MSAAGAISPDWVAVDWGTSNLRAYAMDDSGAVLATASTPRGMGGLGRDDFEPALRDALADWQLPVPCTVIACGMVGSRQGWLEAPYRAVPCPARAGGTVRVETSAPDLEVHLVPGIKQDAPPDVMRGEETQVDGFLNLTPDWDGVICLPGTHSKWVHVSAGEIVSFRTFMTGELFGAISTQTVLRHSLGTPKGTDASSGTPQSSAFEAAVSETLSRPERLGSLLFGLRAADLLHGADPAAARAQLSGALIGAELAAARPYWLGQNVALLGSPHLVALYQSALTLQGASIETCDAAAATRAGLYAVYQHVKGL